MAVVQLFYKMPHRDQTQQLPNITRQSERGFICVSSVSDDMSKKWHSCYLNTDLSSKTKTRARGFSTMVEVTGLHSTVCCASKPSSKSNEKQLRSLGSYFGKLQDSSNLSNSDASNKTTETLSSSESSLKKGLEILDAYLGKLDKDANSDDHASPFVEPEPSVFDEPAIKGSPEVKPHSISEDHERDDEGKLRSYMIYRSESWSPGSKSSQGLQQNDETSDLYLISILAAVNIAVVLFETASPVKNSDLELSSLPQLYGAKVNHLILVGEWWRLVTPMFLHSGVFHIALGCWALLTFGPKVSRGYGSFTFFLIYLLGGISGNFISFLHTSEPTVGGTGPINAIIGAWLIYQIQNKDVIAKDVSESLFQKAMIAIGLGLLLSHFGPIDEWAHFGAVFTGVAYGFFTCPTLQLDDASSSRRGQEEGIALVKRQADPCKSLFLFGLFLLVLSSLLFFIEPPLNDLVSDYFI
ncbi:hypothetical protein UlMin_014415 [Ulmus minor]